MHSWRYVIALLTTVNHSSPEKCVINNVVVLFYCDTKSNIRKTIANHLPLWCVFCS